MDSEMGNGSTRIRVQSGGITVAKGGHNFSAGFVPQKKGSI